MKSKIIFILLILIISSFLLLGCTSSEAPGSDQVSENLTTNQQIQQWSDKVAALGIPTYEDIEVAPGYHILPFPGLEYSGLRDGWQAFYATNKDQTFAIYASPAIITGAGTYDEVKQKVKDEFSAYSSSLKCSDISTNSWLTKTKAFVCSYTYSDYISYKIVTFYKDSTYIQTDLSVWGTELKEYEYVFDEFNQKAVSWK